MTVTVVLAEDSYLMREGLASLLDALDDIELVAAAEDYEELMAADSVLLSMHGCAFSSPEEPAT